MEKDYFEKKADRSKEAMPKAHSSATILMCSQMPPTPGRSDSGAGIGGGALDDITPGEELNLFLVLFDDADRSPVKKRYELDDIPLQCLHAKYLFIFLIETLAV